MRIWRVQDLVLAKIARSSMNGIIPKAELSSSFPIAGTYQGMIAPFKARYLAENMLVL